MLSSIDLQEHMCSADSEKYVCSLRQATGSLTNLAICEVRYLVSAVAGLLDSGRAAIRVLHAFEHDGRGAVPQPTSRDLSLIHARSACWPSGPSFRLHSSRAHHASMFSVHHPAYSSDAMLELAGYCMTSRSGISIKR